MLRLMLLRHAKAATLAGGGDSDRPLADRGRKDAERLGAYMASRGLFPDLAVVSPAKRTRETLDIALDAFGEPCPVRVEPRLYLAEPSTLNALLRQTPDFVRVLLAVGHNPGLHEFAEEIAAPSAQSADLAMGFPTAGLAIIDFPVERWADVQAGDGQITSFVTPETLQDG